MKKVLALLLSAMMVFGAVPAFAEEEAAEGLQQDLVILFTSDVHCGVDQNFGLAGLAQVRKGYEDAGYYTLLVDDGDFIQGEPIGTMTEGEALIDLMNAVGYDVAIPGNHEFDYGMDRFLELAEETEFPYISCNFNKEGELVFAPYVIKEFDGVKFAFVGITTPYTLTSSTPRYFQDEEGNFAYGFFQSDDGELLYSKVQEAVDAAREEGADYVIAMAHLGNEAICAPYTYADVITHTSGIDVFLDGHSHDTDQVIVKNKNGEEVIRSACGTKLGCIGAVTIAKDGTISNILHSWTFPMTAPGLFDIRNSVSEKVSEEMDELTDILTEVVGTTAVKLVSYDPTAVDANGQPIRLVRRTETNLGDLCADAVRYMGEADIAIENGGGIRADIDVGDITKGEILKVHPFGNAICVVKATGQQILDMLEWGARNVPDENGGFLQVSGLSYEIHTYIDSSCTQDVDGMWTGVDGEYRVKNVMVGDEPLDPEKTYTLAGANYILQNQGDGYNMFGDAELVATEITVDNQGLMLYITQALGGVIGEEYQDPYGQGRIVAVEEAPAQKDAPEAAAEEEEEAPAATQAAVEAEASAEPVTEAAAKTTEAAAEGVTEAEAAAEGETEAAAEGETEAPAEEEAGEAEEAPAEEGEQEASEEVPEEAATEAAAE